MNNRYQKFYKEFYLQTGGYLPSKPLGQSLYPGDFFQIKDGKMILLGNIFRKSIIKPEDATIEYGQKLNSASWKFNDGVSKPYSGRGAGNNPIEGAFEFGKQVLHFKNAGSYIFDGKNPESCKISNWNDIEQKLIIKLTQTLYSFRELYVVTECVTTSSWTLAVAGNKNAELEIAIENENFGLVDIFGESGTKTIQSKDIEYYNRTEKRIPNFFKAKKLVISQDKEEVFISDLNQNLEYHSKWASQFFDYDFSESEFKSSHWNTNSLNTIVLDMLQANQLNPNTALQFFSWSDLNLDDIYKLFITYNEL